MDWSTPVRPLGKTPVLEVWLSFVYEIVVPAEYPVAA
jgi:hypothetical protein